MNIHEVTNWRFRGKVEGKWHEWSLLESLGFSSEFIALIDPTTVGLYSGMRDKNGNPIFEGDMLKYEEDRVNPVVFEDGSFQLQGSGGLRPLRYHHLLNNTTLDAEIIGNLHDNPELNIWLYLMAPESEQYKLAVSLSNPN